MNVSVVAADSSASAASTAAIRLANAADGADGADGARSWTCRIFLFDKSFCHFPPKLAPEIICGG